MALLQIWDSVWIALLASAMLYGTYRAVEWRWPERYIGMTQTFGLSSQQTLARFVAYRCGPVYLLAATCFVTVERIGGFAWISAAVVWVFSVALTHGRVVVQGLVRRWGEANYAAYHLVMALVLAVVIVVAVLTVPIWGVLVPSPPDLLTSVWSGLLVAGIGGFAVSVLRPRASSSPSYDEAYFVDRATRDVGIGMLDWLHTECMRTGANPVLLKAILVVEAIQRPRWSRFFERILVWLRVARTSGVMQMTSKRPLTDRESITQAAERYAGMWGLRLYGPQGFESWRLDLGETWSAVTDHNGDAKFATSVMEIAEYLISTVSGSWVSRGSTEPLLLELRRVPGMFIARGITTANELLVVQVNGQVTRSTIAAAETRAGELWWAWECPVSPAAREIAFVDVHQGVASVARIVDGEVAHIEMVSAARYVQDPELFGPSVVD